MGLFTDAVHVVYQLISWFVITFSYKFWQGFVFNRFQTLRQQKPEVETEFLHLTTVKEEGVGGGGGGVQQ